MESLLIGFYSNVGLFMIVAVRFFGFFVVVPIYGGNNIPAMLRISLSLFVAAIVVSTKTLNFEIAYDGYIAFASVLLAELIIGLMIGFIVFFLLSILYYAGQMMDFQIGFAMVSVYDPVTQIQVPITGNLFYLIVCVLIVIMGGDYLLLGLVFESYDAVPINNANFFNQDVFDYIVSMITNFFTIGYRVAMPLVGAILVLDVVLGLLTKVAPQMHLFSVGMVVKILFGLAVLIFSVSLFPNITDTILNEIYTSIFKLIRIIMP